MMKNCRTHEGLVEDMAVLAVRQRLEKEGLEAMLTHWAGIEPRLMQDVCERVQLICGRLALSHAPRAVVKGVYNDILAMLVVALESLREAQIDYWQADHPDAGGDLSPAGDEHGPGDEAASMAAGKGAGEGEPPL